MNLTDSIFPHEFIKEYFGLIAKHIPGETTLNQMRILHFIDMRTADGHGSVLHKEICESLQMSAATVTRAIAGFIRDGIVVEELDPGRRAPTPDQGQPGPRKSATPRP